MAALNTYLDYSGTHFKLPNSCAFSLKLLSWSNLSLFNGIFFNYSLFNREALLNILYQISTGNMTVVIICHDFNFEVNDL